MLKNANKKQSVNLNYYYSTGKATIAIGQYFDGTIFPSSQLSYIV